MDPVSNDVITEHRWTVGGALRQNNYGNVIGIMVLVLFVICLFVSFKTLSDKIATLTALVVCLALCYLPVVLGLLLRPLAASPSAEGLEWRTAFGKGHRPWHEVAQVFRQDIRNVGNARGTTTVVFQDGPTLRFGQSLTDYEVLADRIQHESSQAALAAARSDLENGILRLGPVSVQANGLVVEKTLIPWSDINGYTLINGMFGLVGSGPALESAVLIRLSHLPNYEVLFQVLQERGVPYKPWSPSHGVLNSPSDPSD